MKADVIFLSYLEENADQNWNLLKSRFPFAKRVHGIKGIREAHRKASQLSDSDYLFIVDGDNKITEATRFYLPTDVDADSVYVWRAQNAVNGLIYGYGGIKLWPKKVFDKTLTDYDDHAMSATTHYRIVNEILSVTEFNASKVSSFRAGFRESIKLYKAVVERNESAARQRLKNWLTVGTHAPFGDDCLLGARVGANYYARFPKEALSEINDFEAIDKTYRQALSSVEKFRTANLDYFNDGDRSPLGTVLRTPLYLEQLDFRVEVLDADKSLARFNDNLADFTRRHPQR